MVLQKCNCCLTVLVKVVVLTSNSRVLSTAFVPSILGIVEWERSFAGFFGRYVVKCLQEKKNLSWC
jgi:hypothetical protein